MTYFSRSTALVSFCVVPLALAACGDDPVAIPPTQDGGVADTSPLDVGSDSDLVGDVGSDSDLVGDADIAPDLPEVPATLGGDRPAPYHLPDSYDGVTPMSALIILHGYMGSGTVTVDWWRLADATNDAGMMLIVPEGLVDPGGNPYWNGTDVCCDFWGSDVDDVAYISGLAEEAIEHFGVDPQRVHLIGHSNGGFMAHRLACDRSDLFAGVVNFAGSTWFDAADCGTPSPVSVLQVHGTWDTTIFYSGLPDTAAPDADNFVTCMDAQCSAEFGFCQGTPSCAEMLQCFGTCTDPGVQEACTTACFQDADADGQAAWLDSFTCGLSAGCFLVAGAEGPGYPSATEGAARWATINNCGDSLTDGTPLDLLTELPGDDTYPRAYDGCPPGLASEIWRIQRGSHVPGFNGNWAPAVVEWLGGQAKPSR
jgi:poly(3-hydroxybutyrate) depolymerase